VSSGLAFPLLADPAPVAAVELLEPSFNRFPRRFMRLNASERMKKIAAGASTNNIKSIVLGTGSGGCPNIDAFAKVVIANATVPAATRASVRPACLKCFNMQILGCCLRENGRLQLTLN